MPWLAAIVFGALAAAGPSIAQPITEGTPYSQTVAELGGGDLSVAVPPSDGAPASASLSFRLPEDALQGPHQWYAIRTRFSGQATGGEGQFIFSISLNTFAVVQAEIDVDADGNGILTTADAFLGSYRRVVSKGRIDLTMGNYFQDDAVRGGVNDLSVGLERLSGRGTARVAIDPASRIYTTDEDPNVLVRTAEAPLLVAGTVGKAVRVPYRVSNKTPDHPWREVRVAALAIPDHLETIGEPKRHPTLSHTIAGELEVRPTAAGRLPIRVVVSGEGREQRAVLVAVVVAEPAKAASVLPPALLGSVATVAALAAGWMMRRRRGHG